MNNKALSNSIVNVETKTRLVNVSRNLYPVKPNGRKQQTTLTVKRYLHFFGRPRPALTRYTHNNSTKH